MGTRGVATPRREAYTWAPFPNELSAFALLWWQAAGSWDGIPVMAPELLFLAPEDALSTKKYRHIWAEIAADDKP